MPIKPYCFMVQIYELIGNFQFSSYLCNLKYLPVMKKILCIILLIINLIAAAALILSTLAGAVEPSRMAVISILSY